jgi:hypothetical protein
MMMRSKGIGGTWICLYLYSASLRKVNKIFAATWPNPWQLLERPEFYHLNAVGLLNAVCPQPLAAADGASARRAAAFPSRLDFRIGWPRGARVKRRGRDQMRK